MSAHTSHHGRDGFWEVFSDEGTGQAWPGCEETGVDGLAEGLGWWVASGGV